jgi:hypothetical protein
LKLETNLKSSCCHQCITCGVIYKCGGIGCRMPFQYDRCSSCRQLLNFWFFSTKIVTMPSACITSSACLTRFVFNTFEAISSAHIRSQFTITTTCKSTIWIFFNRLDLLKILFLRRGLAQGIVQNSVYLIPFHKILCG